MTARSRRPTIAPLSLDAGEPVEDALDLLDEGPAFGEIAEAELAGGALLEQAREGDRRVADDVVARLGRDARRLVELEMRADMDRGAQLRHDVRLAHGVTLHRVVGEREHRERGEALVRRLPGGAIPEIEPVPRGRPAEIDRAAAIVEALQREIDGEGKAVELRDLLEVGELRVADDVEEDDGAVLEAA